MPKTSWATLRSTLITSASSLLRVAPPQCHASVLYTCQFSGLHFSLKHHDDWFPQFQEKPDTKSRPLYAGHRLQQHSEFTRRLIPEDRNASGFDVSLWLTTRPHGFGFAVSLVSYLLNLRSCFDLNAHHHDSLSQQLEVV